MTFIEALEKLGIEEYGERIFNSNSSGELSHISDYFILAEVEGVDKWFPEWFKYIVNYAEKNWERPESIFQHIPQALIDSM